nr:BamA/TamA family outer membrane protein [Acidomonas methanolica]
MCCAGLCVAGSGFPESGRAAVDKAAAHEAPAHKTPRAEAYTVTIAPTGNATLDGMITSSSMLVSLQHAGTPGAFALAGRIRGDYDRVAAALESNGYYAGTVTISVSARGKAAVDGRDPSLPQWLQTLPAGVVPAITEKIGTGPLFHVGTIRLVSGPLADEGKAPPITPNTPRGAAAPAVRSPAGETPVTLNAEQRKAFALHDGQPAVAADILAAQSRLQTALTEEGHALANVQPPVAYLRPATKTLDLVFSVGVGPVVDVGPLSFSGLGHVRESFVRRRLQLHEGQLYQPSAIEAARQDLASVGVFASVGVRNAPPLVRLARGEGTPGVTQAMPLLFTFQEAKRHTVSAQAGFSTDLGGRAGVSWTHHNLLGAAEQLKLTMLVTGLGGTAQQGLGYDVYADLLKPDFLRRGQNLSLRVEAIRQLLYSYRQTAFLVRGGIIRHMGRYWNLAGSLSVEQERIRQFGDTRNYMIASIPLQVSFDDTNVSNPIEPATHGVRATVGATPSVSLENQTSFFTILSAQFSTYFDLNRIGLSRPGRSVIAVRGIAGSVQGASTWEIPPDQRLYAGGPATVRGFRYQGVGPQYGKYAIGGTSMDAGSVEFRQRFFKSFGAAMFADAGQVASGSRPFQGTLRVGYGAGVRYFTPIGPVRVDVALPVNRPPQGDKWELYVGLGETF